MTRPDFDDIRIPGSYKGGIKMIRALLTIDDVSSKNTPAIVDYLNEKKIKQVIFAVGQWAENHLEDVKA